MSTSTSTLNSLISRVSYPGHFIYICSGKEGFERFPLINKIYEYTPEYQVKITLFGRTSPSEKDLIYLCGIGDLETLILLRKKGFEPGRKGQEEAARHGQLRVLKWMYRFGGWLPNLITFQNACEFGSIPILDWIESHTIVTDKTLVHGATSACEEGRIEVLEWIEKRGRLPDTEHALSYAARDGHLDVLKWYRAHKSISARFMGVWLASIHGHLKILDWFKDQGYYHFSPIYVTDASERGQLSILKWMAENDPGFVLNPDAVYLALINGHLDIVNWCIEKGLNFIPLPDWADRAARNGHLPVLKWLASRDPPVFPTISGANKAAENGHLDILEWMAPKKLPERDVVQSVCQHGHLEVLKFLVSLKLIPTFLEGCSAIRYGHLSILEWLKENDLLEIPEDFGIFPIIGYLNRAAEKGFLDVLKFMYTISPVFCPNFIGANMAAEEGQMEVLEWLYCLSVIPDIEGANGAAKNGHIEVLKWLSERSIFPDFRGADEAVYQCHLDVLKMMAVYGIYPVERLTHIPRDIGHTSLDIILWLQDQKLISWEISDIKNEKLDCP